MTLGFRPTTAPDILILADDLTGALESGAAFGQRGIEAAVVWDNPRHLPSTPVLVIDTETRHQDAASAGERIQNLSASIPARVAYKKTDSTLRGNIRAELVAFSHAGQVTYVPAYPKLGRTVRDGHLHVHDLPVETTSFGQDPLHPITDGNLSRLLEGASGVTVCEANTDSELEQIAEQWMREGGRGAGPAGALHALARVMAPTADPPVFPRVGKALVVVGSRNECSQRQVAEGTCLFSELGWELLAADREYRGNPLAFAGELGARAAKQLSEGRFDTCIVFGGDTALATLRALHCSALQPLGEVIPGVPLSVLPSRMTLITKAGGFGPPELLLQLHEQLTHA